LVGTSTCIIALGALNAPVIPGMADLVGFHRREAKPAWWAFFDRKERGPEELQEDEECLGGCVADGTEWIGKDKRSLTFRYRYPEQGTKLGSPHRLLKTAR